MTTSPSRGSFGISLGTVSAGWVTNLALTAAIVSNQSSFSAGISNKQDDTSHRICGRALRRAASRVVIGQRTRKRRPGNKLRSRQYSELLIGFLQVSSHIVRRSELRGPLQYQYWLQPRLLLFIGGAGETGAADPHRS